MSQQGFPTYTTAESTQAPQAQTTGTGTSPSEASNTESTESTATSQNDGGAALTSASAAARASRKRTKTGCLSKLLCLRKIDILRTTSKLLVSLMSSLSKASYKMWRRTANLRKLCEIEKDL